MVQNLIPMIPSYEIQTKQVVVWLSKFASGIGSYECCDGTLGVWAKLVNTVPVLAVLTGMYTGIKISTFRTNLNTGCTGHVPAISANFGQYQPI